MSIKYMMYVKSVKWDATRNGYILYLSNKIKVNSVDFAGYTTPNTVFTNGTAPGLLVVDDELEFVADPNSGEIFSMLLVKPATPAPQTTVNVNTANTFNCEVSLIVVGSAAAHHGPSISAVITVSMEATLDEPYYNLLYTKSTIGPADGIKSLVKGDRLTIVYDTDRHIHEIDLYVDPLEEFIVKEDVVSNPAEWTNLCKMSVMYICGAADKTVRPSCHFWENATVRLNDCMYHRETVAGACDCTPAHKHLQEFGHIQREKSVKTDSFPSYDELLQQRFGKKV
jgi:hypothetical protein